MFCLAGGSSDVLKCQVGDSVGGWLRQSELCQVIYDPTRERGRVVLFPATVQGALCNFRVFGEDQLRGGRAVQSRSHVAGVLTRELSELAAQLRTGGKYGWSERPTGQFGLFRRPPLEEPDCERASGTRRRNVCNRCARGAFSVQNDQSLFAPTP